MLRWSLFRPRRLQAWHVLAVVLGKTRSFSDAFFALVEWRFKAYVLGQLLGFQIIWHIPRTVLSNLLMCVGSLTVAEGAHNAGIITHSTQQNRTWRAEIIRNPVRRVAGKPPV